MESYPQPAGGDVTALLRLWSDGDEQAFERLMPLVYDELHRMALRYLAGERSDVSLQATALVNELCLRLLGWDQARWQNRGHFFGVSAQMMRRVLVDIARRRRANRRGGAGAVHVPLESVDLPANERDKDLVAIDGALEKLAAEDPRRARLVELRFFGGLSMEETAEALGCLGPHGVQRVGVRPRLALPRHSRTTVLHEPDTAGPAVSTSSTRRGNSRPTERTDIHRRDRAERMTRCARRSISLLEADAASGEFMVQPGARPARAGNGSWNGWSFRAGDDASVRTPSFSCSAPEAPAKCGARATIGCVATSPSKCCCLTWPAMPIVFADLRKKRGRPARSITRTSSRCYDVGEHQGIPYLVSECLEGRSLRQRLDAGPIAVEEALAIALGVARGLAAAHARVDHSPGPETREHVSPAGSAA